VAQVAGLLDLTAKDGADPGIDSCTTLDAQTPYSSFHAKSARFGYLSRRFVANVGSPAHPGQPEFVERPDQSERQRAAHHVLPPRPWREPEADLCPFTLVKPQIDRPCKAALKLDRERGHDATSPALGDMINEPSRIRFPIWDRDGGPALALDVLALVNDGVEVILAMTAQQEIRSVGHRRRNGWRRSPRSHP
jgi:hypothetical protein